MASQAKKDDYHRWFDRGWGDYLGKVLRPPSGLTAFKTRAWGDGWLEGAWQDVMGEEAEIQKTQLTLL